MEFIHYTICKSKNAVSLGFNLSRVSRKMEKEGQAYLEAEQSEIFVKHNEDIMPRVSEFLRVSESERERWKQQKI